MTPFQERLRGNVDDDQREIARDANCAVSFGVTRGEARRLVAGQKREA